MDDLILGNHREHGFGVSIPTEALTVTHTHVLGSTGVGKTYALANLACQLISEGHGVIILDGVGQIYELVTDQLLYTKFPAHKMELIDPKQKRLPGINYLELLFQNADPETWAPTVLQGIRKMFREGDERKVWFEKYGLMALIPLIRQEMTLLELGPFCSEVSPELRETILAQEENPTLSRLWDDYLNLQAAEKERRISSTETRGDILSLDAPPLRRILGQAKTSIDWRGVMDKGGVVLADCRRGQHLTDVGSQILGTVLMDQLVRTAYDRPAGRARPCFVIADEFQRFVSPDFAEALTTLRNYGVYFILSHQVLAHLDDVPTLRAAVMGNCKNKMLFSVGAEDAGALVDDLYAGSFPYYRVKDEIYRTIYHPEEQTRTITSHSVSDGEAESSGDSQQMTYDTTPLFFGPGDLAFTGSATSSGRGSSHAEGTTETEVPFYKLHRGEELSSRTFFSHEETRHFLQSGITAQDRREMLLKVGSNPPIPLRTADYEPTGMSPKLREMYLQRILSKYQDLAAIDAESSERVKQYLDTHSSNYDITPDTYIEDSKENSTVQPSRPKERVRRSRGRRKGNNPRRGDS